MMTSFRRRSAFLEGINLPRIFTAVPLCAVLLSSCVARKPEVTPVLGPRSPIEEEEGRTAAPDRSVSRQSEAHFAFLLGQIALDGERFDDALKHFREAARIEKGPAPTLRKSIAQIYVRLGKLDDALKEVDRASKQSPDDLELLELRAGILAAQHDLSEAIRTYQRIATLQGAKAPDELFIMVASLEAQQDDLGAAKETLKKLLIKNPRSFLGHYYLGRILEAGKEHTEAEASYLRALKLSPDAESVKLDLARVYGVQKRFAEGIALCEEVIKENPRNAQAENLLGQLLVGNNNLDKAVEAFEAAGRLEEDPSQMRLRIALIKIQRRDLEGAIGDLNFVLAEHPENSLARYYLASALFGSGKVTESLKEIEKFEKGQEFYEESRVLGSLALQQAKRYQESLAMVEELLKEKPNDAKYLSLRLSIEREAEDLAAAEVTARKLCENEPKNDIHQFLLATILDGLGKKNEAIASMKAAIELNPRNANALNYLGYTYAEQGQNLQEAETLIQRALAEEKDNGYFLDSLGWVYFRQGKFKDAERELARAVGITGSDAVILEHYAVVLQKLGKREEALDVVQRGLLHAGESDDKEVGERLKKLASQLEKK